MSSPPPNDPVAARRFQEFMHLAAGGEEIARFLTKNSAEFNLGVNYARAGKRVMAVDYATGAHYGRGDNRPQITEEIFAKLKSHFGIRVMKQSMIERLADT